MSRETTTTIHSPAAMLLGLICAGTTGYVLLEDVVYGAAFTVPHLLAIVTILIAIAAGHMAWPALRSGRILGGLGLAVLFVAATAYVVVSSGSRNAEHSARKAEAINQANADRAVIEPKLKEAREMLDTQRMRVRKECNTGEGTLCKGAKASLAVYEAAVSGYEGKLEKLPPHREANAGFAHVARVIAALPGVSMLAPEIEGRLALVMPFLLVLVVEAGTVVFFGLALGHKARAVVIEPPSGTRAPVAGNVVALRPVPIDPVLAAVRRIGPCSNVELAREIGCTPSAATKMRRRVRHHLEVRREGGRLRIAAR